MAARAGGDRYNLTPQFSGELSELLGRKGFDVGGAVNGFEKSGGRNVHQI
jgi:hypothetical protein